MNTQQRAAQVRLVREAAQKAGEEWARKAEVAELPGLKHLREASILTAADKAWTEYCSVFVDPILQRFWQSEFYTVFGRAARGES
jgi:hypothetical protein